MIVYVRNFKVRLFSFLFEFYGVCGEILVIICVDFFSKGRSVFLGFFWFLVYFVMF